jgi:hypothetical protein
MFDTTGPAQGTLEDRMGVLKEDDGEERCVGGPENPLNPQPTSGLLMGMEAFIREG